MIGIGFVVIASRSYAARSSASISTGARQVAVASRPDLLGDLRADDVRVHADAADRAELEEREDDVVVAGIEVEPRFEDVASLREARVGLLHGADRRDLGEPRDRLGLDVHDDAARDVVGDDRPVARAGDRLEVSDDPRLRRLDVVRRHHEEGVGAEGVRAFGQLDRMSGRGRAGVRDDRRVVADRLDSGADEIETFRVVERRALAGRARDDDPVRTVIDQVPRECLEGVVVDSTVVAERRDDRRQDRTEHGSIVETFQMARFVLVHGAWHGGWCWERLAAELRGRGHDVTAPDLPCDELGLTAHDYAARTGSDGESVVVGHSLAGLVIPFVPARLTVFLAALVPVEGVFSGLVRGFPATDHDAARPLVLADARAHGMRALPRPFARGRGVGVSRGSGLRRPVEPVLELPPGPCASIVTPAGRSDPAGMAVGDGPRGARSRADRARRGPLALHHASARTGGSAGIARVRR